MKDGMHIGRWGTKFWYKDGQKHREDGPAYEDADGDKEWWVNGQRHREDGPAVIWENGYKSWYLNGARHREDGPAVIWPDGNKEWWLYGTFYSSFGNWLEKMNFSDDDKLILKLKWS